MYNHYTERKTYLLGLRKPRVRLHLCCHLPLDCPQVRPIFWPLSFSVRWDNICALLCHQTLVDGHVESRRWQCGNPVLAHGGPQPGIVLLSVCLCILVFSPSLCYSNGNELYSEHT